MILVFLDTDNTLKFHHCCIKCEFWVLRCGTKACSLLWCRSLPLALLLSAFSGVLQPKPGRFTLSFVHCCPIHEMPAKTLKKHDSHEVGSLVLSYFPWSLLWNKTVQLNELAKHSQTPSSPSQLCSKNAGEQLLSDNPYPKEQMLQLFLLWT